MKMSKVLIMGASRYDFKDESGRTVKGCKIAILDTSEDSADNVHGVMPKYITAPIEAFENFEKAPAFYDVDFTVKLGNKKPVLNPTKFTYVSPFHVTA